MSRKSEKTKVASKLAAAFILAVVAFFGTTTTQAQESSQLRPRTPQKFDRGSLNLSNLRSNNQRQIVSQSRSQPAHLQQPQKSQVALASYDNPIANQELHSTPEKNQPKQLSDQAKLESASLPYDIERLNQRDPVRQSQKIDLGQTIQKLAFSTLVVLVGCVVVLVAIKKFGLSRVAPAPSESSGELRIIDSLDVGAKCQIRLVQVKNHKLVVAVDATGIKSVLHLSGAFTDALHEPTG